MNVKSKREIPANILNAIMQMFSCNGFIEEFACLSEYYEDLKECSFLVYSDNEGIELPKFLKSNYENDFAIIEIGFSDKYYAIDHKIGIEMITKGEAKYNLDTCVELDTQAVSYLKSMFKSCDEIYIPEDKKELFYYLTSPDVNYSSLPYMIENASKITNDNFEEVYLNLKSYEMFKNFNFREYIDNGYKIFKNEESTMMINTDEMYNTIKSKKFFDNMKDYYDMQENTYCLLMKAISIEFQYSKKSISNKMKMLSDFVNEKLGVFCEREMAICYYYFGHYEETKKFFKKINKNSRDLNNTIKGMAWDLTHVRMLERLYNFTPEDSIKFGIHPILTYDNGLKDVLKLYPVKKMAIYKDYTIPCFKTKFYELFPESAELLFGEDVRAQRMKTFSIREIKKMIFELEKEFEMLCS